MPLVKYASSDGRIDEIEVKAGHSVMEGAVENMLDGIVAECGGSCSCATCHVYVDEEWVGKLPPPDEMEKDMLECVLEPKDTSRLSCQIKMTEDLDGLVVHIPDSQF